MPRPSFLIVGFGGYIAPRHISAIKDLDGEIKGIIDIKFDEDSLNLLPRNIQKASTLDEYFNKYPSSIDYLVICSPNFLHEEQIIKGLEMNMDIISEKPLALNGSGLLRLKNAEDNSEGKINCILQLRLHPVVEKLKLLVDGLNEENHEINLVYVAKRDDSYFETWKGDISLSGGLLLNLGVHYFDLLLNVFGESKNIFLEENSIRRSKGSMDLKKGSVNWLFSFEKDDIEKLVPRSNSAYRSITVDGNEIEFSNISEDLHTKSYREILSGNGFSLKDASSSINLIDKINNHDNE